MNTSTPLLTSADVMTRYSISDMTLHRWLKNQSLKFPRPLVINRRRFFRSEDLAAWEVERQGDAA